MAEIEHSPALRVVDKPRVAKRRAMGIRVDGYLAPCPRQRRPGFANSRSTTRVTRICGFCNFARDKFPKAQWKYVERQGAARRHRHPSTKTACVIWSGPAATDAASRSDRVHRTCERARHEGDAGLERRPLQTRQSPQLYEAGTSSFIISVDAASVEAHENNRGLPGVCEKIKDTNRVLKELGVQSTASVTMSRLLDYDKLPAFLEELVLAP